ncbi:hypothetical protein ACUXAV_006176 [Cupriavidus metallidurans]|nr:hypothetical protein Cmtc_57940 [Cupriavidus sp. TKC]
MHWLFAVLAMVSITLHAQEVPAHAAPFKPEEFEALVAPIALYPDSVLT